MVSVEAEGLVHDAFVYFSADEFSAGTLPFLEEGIELGEPILAAPTERNAQLLRERLGERAEEVDWADDPESHRTVQRLATFLDYIEHHRNSGSGRIRLLGEPCWPEDGGPGVAEWKRYESYLNVALAEHPVWLVCPYDGSRLSADIVADARLTHPNIGYGKGRTSCPDYLEPSAFARRIDNVPLSPPPDDSAQGYFSKAGAVRRFVREQAERSGLARAKLRDAEIAAGEIAGTHRGVRSSGCTLSAPSRP